MQSLDIVLGLVGGVSGVVWALLSYALGDYEQFKYENSLVGSIYPTSPFGGKDSDESAAQIVESEREAKTKMMRTVAERGKYFYSYFESRITVFLKLFCSCCLKDKDWYQKRVKRLERHKEASDMLADEIDIVKFIYVLRIGQFISKMILNKHQRALVTSFKKYQLNDLGLSVEDGRAERSQSLLASGIQEDGTISDFDQFAKVDGLTEG